LPISGS